MNSTIAALLTNPTTIIDEVSSKLKMYEDTMEELMELSVKFTNLYDNNIIENFGDTTYLKRKMKEAVIMAVNDEL